MIYSQSVLAQVDIVGGDDANIEDYPYQAALLYNSGGWVYAFCGASIINEYWILTAAHCVEDESAIDIEVRVGSDNTYAQGGSTYDADEIIMHSDYNSNTYNNDIALIKLNNPINFNNFTQPVVLVCDVELDLGVQDPGETAWVTGWGNTEGTTNSSQLQVVAVPITTESNYGVGQINADMIMAGYQDGGYDSCQGDSGGPMVVLADDDETYLQCGIVSWGNGCADVGYPGVYTRVSYFTDWICDNTDGDVCANESNFCTVVIAGCMDITAENYNADATLDDGSCEYVCDQIVSLAISFDCWPEETGWSISNENGSVIASQVAGYYSSSDTVEDICVSEEDCYVFTITDSYGDGLGGSQWGGCSIDGSYDVSAGGYVLVSGAGDFGSSISHEFCVIMGCAEEGACNYDFSAIYNDGSCFYAEEYYDCDGNCLNDLDNDGVCGELEVIGCTDPSACNYDALATDDDDACNYADTYTDCDGNCIVEIDCNGECGGNAVLDECGDCDGDGISQGTCDCDGNVDLGCGCGNPEALDGYDCDGNPIILTQYIQFEPGWNMWSTYIEETGSMSTLFEGIEENVIIVKDQNGNVYWPEYALNSIGNLTIGEGYQIKVGDYAYLALSGSVVPYNQEISLDAGWNIMGYLHQDLGDVVQFFEPYSEDIVILKDEDGNVYWPEYQLNSIGNMLPGKGYQIKTLVDFNFSYEDLTNGRVSFIENVHNIYFEQPERTGNNMTILFPYEITHSLLSEYDEIAAYDQNGLLVGSTVVSNGHNTLTVWGDDSTTLEKDGLFEGEEIIFKIWNNKINMVYDIKTTYSEGIGLYAINGISIIGSCVMSVESQNLKLIKTLDVLGRDVSQSNQSMFFLYLYDNGTIEKKHIIKK